MCGEDMKNFKFQVGDRVQWATKRGIKVGRVKCHSYGWNPPRYRVYFDDGSAVWLSKESLDFDKSEEMVVFS